MEHTLADALGVLGGVTVAMLMRETMPQLRFVLRHRGRIMWPRLRPIVEGNFQPSEEGVKDIIRNHYLRQSGVEPPRTPAQRDREFAWRIVASSHTGEPVEEASAVVVKPIEGLSTEAAAAVLAWASSEDCPEDIYVRDVAPMLRGLRVTAVRSEGKLTA